MSQIPRPAQDFLVRSRAGRLPRAIKTNLYHCHVFALRMPMLRNAVAVRHLKTIAKEHRPRIPSGRHGYRRVGALQKEVNTALRSDEISVQICRARSVVGLPTALPKWDGPRVAATSTLRQGCQPLPPCLLGKSGLADSDGESFGL